MKTTSILLPAMLLFALVTHGTTQEARNNAPAGIQKIATIDMRKAYSEYWKTKKGIETLRQKRLNKEGEVKKMLEERQKMIVAHQKMTEQLKNPALGEAERNRFEKIMRRKFQEIQEIEQAMQQYERATNTELQNDHQKLVKTIIDEIRGLVSAMAKERGYTFVLDSSAVSPSQLVVVFNTGKDNLTKEIQEQLEATNPDKAVKVPGKPPAPKK